MLGEFSHLGAISAYELLGVQPGATDEAIIEAHRRLIQHHHPDAGGSARVAQLVNDAKRVLLTRRRDYDAWLACGGPAGDTAQGEQNQQEFVDPWDAATQNLPPTNAPFQRFTTQVPLPRPTEALGIDGYCLPPAGLPRLPKYEPRKSKAGRIALLVVLAWMAAVIIAGVLHVDAAQKATPPPKRLFAVEGVAVRASLAG